MLKIGVAPALQAQYFVAGIPALGLLILVYLIFNGFRGFLFNRWARWFAACEVRTQGIWVAILFITAVAATIYVNVVPDDVLRPFDAGLANSWFELGLLALTVVATVMLMALVFAGGAERLSITVLLIVELLIFAYAGLTTFIATTYISWPQHLGGRRNAVCRA